MVHTAALTICSAVYFYIFLHRNFYLLRLQKRCLQGINTFRMLAIKTYKKDTDFVILLDTIVEYCEGMIYGFSL